MSNKETPLYRSRGPKPVTSPAFTVAADHRKKHPAGAMCPDVTDELAIETTDEDFVFDAPHPSE